MPTVLDDPRAVPRATEEEWKFGVESAMRAMTPPDSSVRRTDPRETSCPTTGQQKLAKAGIKHLSAIIADANELLQNPFEDEFGRLIHTTEFSHKFCCNILVEAAIADALERSASGTNSSCVAIPAAVVSSDEQGGIRVEWVRDTASVHLVIPADERSERYIYVEVGEEYRTEPATPAALARALRNIE